MSVEVKVKRRYWTQVQKEAILRKYEQGEESLSDLARRHQIHPVQLYKWRRKMIEQKRAISANVLPDVKELLEELKQTKEENEYLKKALGEMAMDKQILKAANEILKKSQNQARFTSQRRFYRRRTSKK